MKSTKGEVYPVIVIGAGHAGCEAALACARMGLSTLVITLHKDNIGLMSCNPAVGGIGKAQLVKEIDALGGEMARATDACGIQFRTLNASKGAAVHSLRAQVDRKKYSLYMQRALRKQKNLKVHCAEVVNILIKDNVACGVETSGGEKIRGETLIITPGTFLNGLIHMGEHSFPGGRLEEQISSSKLSDNLRQLGFNILRFKTGTCARLDGRTIDFSRLKMQNGDSPPRAFSFSTKKLNLKQAPCYITYTDEKVHNIIRKNLHLSALYSGKITGTGVRYCPSFEDKVVKFPHHLRHQIFLEPEGRDANEYYPNGLSSSLPQEVQEEFIHSIGGLEGARITRFGYGIEHDVVDSTQLYPTLETKLVKNLYLAGQVNGTTGYEEAAAQGLLAGINAALRVKERAPFVLDRATCYIGVLVDDLTTKGTFEPYRMFTSRVEYRLMLRQDNADLRLRKFGYELGLVTKEEYDKTQEKQRQIQAGIKYLRENKKSSALSLYQLLRRPQVKIEDLELPFAASADVLREIESEVKYSGFIRRQLAEVRSFRHLEKIKIPADLDYSRISGLSREIKEKLTKFKPMTLGQAERISGITPAAIMLLTVYLKKLKNSPQDFLYYRFSQYLKERFGCRVHKVSIDAGFSCPNRDGTKSKEGCIFCDNRGFSFNSRIAPRPIDIQIKEGINAGRKRFNAEKFIAYFQAYTNTYASVKELKEKYAVVKKFKDIVGVSLGTRPDCISEEILDLIEGYSSDYEVWIEYGLQSIHKKTLDFINRGHSYEDFLQALEKTRTRKGIKVCAHVILGLPHETKEDMLQTAKELGNLKLDGLKIHPLHIIKGTKLDELFRKGAYKPLKLTEYIDLTSEFLEYLWPQTVIQRLAADLPRELLVESLWILEKSRVLKGIEEALSKKGSFQGKLYPFKEDVDLSG